MLRVKCSQCGKSVRGGDDWAGRRARCPNCKAELVFPVSAVSPEQVTVPVISADQFAGIPESLSVASPSRAPKETETKSAKVEGVVAGCLAGWGASGCLISLGALLSLTGIGAIIGVPLILGGLLAPFLGPVVGLGALKGSCPWCGTQVTTTMFSQGVNCPACKHRIVIRDKRFIKIE